MQPMQQQQQEQMRQQQQQIRQQQEILRRQQEDLRRQREEWLRRQREMGAWDSENKRKMAQEEYHKELGQLGQTQILPDVSHKSHPWASIFTFLLYLIVGFVVGFLVAVAFAVVVPAFAKWAMVPAFVTWGVTLLLAWRSARRVWRGA